MEIQLKCKIIFKLYTLVRNEREKNLFIHHQTVPMAGTAIESN
jgi:hypothetical protein